MSTKYFFIERAAKSPDDDRVTLYEEIGADMCRVGFYNSGTEALYAALDMCKTAYFLRSWPVHARKIDVPAKPIKDPVTAALYLGSIEDPEAGTRVVFIRSRSGDVCAEHYEHFSSCGWRYVSREHSCTPEAIEEDYGIRVAN